MSPFELLQLLYFYHSSETKMRTASSCVIFCICAQIIMINTPYRSQRKGNVRYAEKYSLFVYYITEGW
jgi:hypothetical protein